MSKTIMVVEDSTSVRFMIQTTLKDAGYEVIEAENGQVALDKLEGQSVDLFLCDINMPVMDGLSLLKELKQHPEYKFIPVLMLTTEAHMDKINEAKSAGAGAWIIKPFKTSSLLATVQKLIKK